MQLQLIVEGFNLLNTTIETVGTGNQNQYRATLAGANGHYTFTSLEGATGFGVTNGYATVDPRQAQAAIRIIF